MTTETGWVIEDGASQLPRYLATMPSGNLWWSGYNHDAIRFAREIDARKMARSLQERLAGHMFRAEPRIVDHMWTDGKD